MASIKFIIAQIELEGHDAHPMITIMLACFGFVVNVMGRVLLPSKGYQCQPEDLVEQILEDLPVPEGSIRIANSASSVGNRRREDAVPHRSKDYVHDLHIHPASLRNEIIRASIGRDFSTESDGSADDQTDSDAASESVPLFGASSTRNRHRRRSHPTKSYRHSRSKPIPRTPVRHLELDLAPLSFWDNFDLLSNVSTLIIAGLVTKYPGPLVSRIDQILAIFIIFYMAVAVMPVLSGTYRVLLQATPTGISVDDLIADILDLPGILTCHHVHVWSLDGGCSVATLHVGIFATRSSREYMELRREVRAVCREYGVSSVTVQPEFLVADTNECADDSESEHDEGCRANTPNEETRA